MFLHRITRVALTTWALLTAGSSDILTVHHVNESAQRHNWSENVQWQTVNASSVKRVVDSGRKKMNQLRSVISNRDVNLNAHRVTFTVCRKAYSTVWECTVER